MKFIQHSGFEEITRALLSKKGIFKLDGRCELYSCDKIPPSVSVSSSASSSSSSSSTSSSSSSSSGLTRGVSAQPTYFKGEASKPDEVITARRPRSSTIDHSPIPKQGRYRSKYPSLLKVCLSWDSTLLTDLYEYDTTQPMKLTDVFFFSIVN